VREPCACISWGSVFRVRGCCHREFVEILGGKTVPASGIASSAVVGLPRVPANTVGVIPISRRHSIPHGPFDPVDAGSETGRSNPK
jgi:hypothetical protein